MTRYYLFLLIFINTFSYSQELADIQRPPFNCVCRVLKYSDGISYSASGFLIAQNVMITNAHVLLEADSMVISPGYTPARQDNINQEVVIKLNTNAFYPEGFKNSTETPQLDYALVALPESFTHVSAAGCFSLREFNNTISDKFNTVLNISGYPHWKFFEISRKRNYQYYNSGKLVRGFGNQMPDANLNYKWNTRKSNSGSPIWIEKDGLFLVVGIHKSGSGFKDQGVEITPEVLGTITTWLNGLPPEN